MPVTMEQVLEILGAEEPDYGRGVELGPEALPHLEAIVQGPDIGLAAKAVSLAALIPDPRAAELVELAARDSEPIVRVAAAAAAQSLPAEQSAGVMVALLGDEDIGVRKVALESVAADAPEEVRQRVAALSDSDAEPSIRELSGEVLSRMTA